MSIGALEKALWQVYQNPADTQRYLTDAGAYAQAFKLGRDEQLMLASYDVMAMISHGANPLLVMMGFQTVKGVQRLPEYFAIVNQSGGDAPAA